jgi:hypothetical protein
LKVFWLPGGPDLPRMPAIAGQNSGEIGFFPVICGDSF